MSFATYLKNFQEKTGLSPEQFEALADRKGFTDNGKINAGVKATAIINWLKEDYALGHGHALAMYAYIKGKRS